MAESFVDYQMRRRAKRIHEDRSLTARDAILRCTRSPFHGRLDQPQCFLLA